MNVELEIIWCNNKITRLSINDEILWETEEVIVDTEFETTFVVLPIKKMINFIVVLCSGLKTNYLTNLIKEANKLVEKFKEK